MTVTADPARVLRMPGTLNHKYDPPRPVRLKYEGGIFNPEDILQYLDKVTAPAPGATTAIALAGKPPGKPPAAKSATLSGTMQALASNSITYFKNIMVRTAAGTGCGQLQHYVDNAQEDGMEPLWRGVLSWAKVCTDGNKAAVKLTALHPYTEARMQQKLAEIKGPYSCIKMDSENPGICGNCPHWGKITNPLVFGRETALAVEPPVYEAQSEDTFFHPGTSFTAPPPPRNFAYGDNGGIYKYETKLDSQGNESRELVMVLPYNFFLIDILNSAAEHTARFMAIKQHTVVNIAIDLKDVSKKDSCTST
jgi:hypothetical protein